MDYRPTSLWQKAGLEYVGETTSVYLITRNEKYTHREEKVPQTPPEFLEFVSHGNIGVSFVLNPFEPDRDGSFAVDLVRSEFARVVISQGNDKCEVAHGKGQIRDYRTGIPVYTGEFDLGFRSGSGRAPIYLGSRTFEGDYQGEWKFSMRHGKGQVTYTDGTVFRGNFSHDQKSGLGVETDSLGGKYVGLWRDGVRHGSGEYTWRGGAKFEAREYEYGKLVRFYDIPVAMLKEAAENIDLNLSASVAAAGVEIQAAIVESEPKPAPGPFAGLGPRKALQTVLERTLPDSAAKLSKILGKNVTFTVNEQSIKDSPIATTVLYNLSADGGAYGSEAINTAIKSICEDSFVKEIVVDKLNKIYITHNQDTKAPTTATFNDGLLTISHHFGKNIKSTDVAKEIGNSL